MKNPLKGLVVWAVPENKEASITLFGDPRSQEFEEKFWNFVLEDVSGPFRLMQLSLGFSESLILRKLLEKVLVETVPIHKNSGFLFYGGRIFRKNLHIKQEKHIDMSLKC